MTMFEALENINRRPKPFEFYTASDLWTDAHTSAQMLAFHLNEVIDVASRKAAFIDRSVAWMASAFNIGRNSRIADFGCGPGLYAARLAARGADVTGVDFSGRSIDYARDVAAREQLQINYVQQNYLDFESDQRFDLIVMIMCDFCALGPDQRRQMLQKFRNLLKPGGSVLLDVYSLTAFAKRRETAAYEANLLDGFWSPDPYYGFLNTYKYEKEKVILDKYTIVEAQRTRTVYNWLQHFDPQTLKQEFTAAGLTVADIYADVAGTPYDPASDEFAVTARRS